jgi:hypothetical protein
MTLDCRHFHLFPDVLLLIKAPDNLCFGAFPERKPGSTFPGNALWEPVFPGVYYKGSTGTVSGRSSCCFSTSLAGGLFLLSPSSAYFAGL